MKLTREERGLMEHKIYWDETNGRVTTDKRCALIVEGNDIYIETYELTDENRLDIAYSEITKQNFNMFDYRDSICRQHGYTIENLWELIRFTVPKEIYKQMYEKVYPDGEKGD